MCCNAGNVSLIMHGQCAGMECIMSGKIDDLLKEALIPSKKPDAQLNQEILRKAMEGNNMRKPFLKTVPVMVAAAVAVLTAGSLTAYGAWKYLTTEQVAEEASGKKLADAFKEKGSVNINESQEYGDYKITLMGTVSGDKIGDYFIEDEDNGEIYTDRTYSVISIEKKDGSPMPDTSDDDYENKFLVSPFIKGEDPAFLNIYYMDGGCSSFVKDGVEYRLADHDNIEAFANRGVYLGVLGDVFYDREAYNFNKGTGEITRNEKYKGINALFELPLDKSRADEEKAEKLLKKWKSGDKENNDEESTDNETNSDNTDEWDWKRVKKECTIIKDSVRTYPSAGYNEIISYSPETKWKGISSEGEISFSAEWYFDKEEYGTKLISSVGDGKNTIYTVAKRARNGEITISQYHN